VIYHPIHTSNPFAYYFWDRMLHFLPGWPGLQSSYLGLPHSWDNRCAPLMPSFIGWDGGVFPNFLPRLASNCNPPHLCLLSSRDYRCEPLHLPCIALFSWLKQIHSCLVSDDYFSGLQANVDLACSSPLSYSDMV
jgi:hypothetical protein